MQSYTLVFPARYAGRRRYREHLFGFQAWAVLAGLSVAVGTVLGFAL